MISKFDYGGKCWWCGSQADSAEHKYKKADLVREFGRGPYKEDDALLRVVDSDQRNIQGPASKEVKFPNVLCQRCNNERSQSFDRAYDTFTDFIRRNEEEIYTKRQFNFSDIYGSDWQSRREDLIKYYVKHICCRLASEGVSIKPEIIHYLNGGSDLKYLAFHFEIREDIVAMIKHSSKHGMNSGGLWIGDMPCMISPSTGAISEIHSHLGYRWLRLYYMYDERIPQFESNFPDNLVVLESGYNIDPETILNM